jgi:hypothetical protein
MNFFFDFLKIWVFSEISREYETFLNNNIYDRSFKHKIFENIFYQQKLFNKSLFQRNNILTLKKQGSGGTEPNMRQ